jgi:hypothetical protein
MVNQLPGTYKAVFSTSDTPFYVSVAPVDSDLLTVPYVMPDSFLLAYNFTSFIPDISLPLQTFLAIASMSMPTALCGILKMTYLSRWPSLVPMSLTV